MSNPREAHEYRRKNFRCHVEQDRFSELDVPTFALHVTHNGFQYQAVSFTLEEMAKARDTMTAFLAAQGKETVTACNAHDDLVEALKEARFVLGRYILDERGSSDPDVVATIHSCSAALAKAEASDER